MTASKLSLPVVVVEMGGRRLTTEELEALSGVRVQGRLSRPAQCELTFFREPGAQRLISRLEGGRALQVWVGEESEPLFQGEATAVEYGYAPDQGRTLRVRGYDRLHRLGKRGQIRAHVQVGLTDLARELAADLGVSVAGASSPVFWRHLIQHGQSDLGFLAERAESCGLYFRLRGEVLEFLTLEGAGTAESLELGTTLLEARFELNEEGVCGAVAAAGWDPLRAEAHAGRAGRARVGREVSARVPPSWGEGARERNLVARAMQDDLQAEALAQAELDARAAREVVFWGVAEGSGRLRPGQLVEVGGVAAEFEGRYVLTVVTHILDREQGFVSELSTLPPQPGPRPSGTLILHGLVTRVNDPEGWGRVQVSLPACGEVETDWMGVVMAGAGVGKGLVVMPEVGDRVLVLCAQGDPAQGVVLGGLYGIKGPPDSGVEGEKVQRHTWVTGGGQRVRLDDERQIVRLENSAGSSVELAPGRVVVHAATDLRIEAPGREITICGRAINFEEA